MSLYTSIHRIAANWMEARRMAETERFIGALPREIRKDLGWPSESGRTSRRSNLPGNAATVL